MKAFFVGLLFLFFVTVFAALGFLLFPLFIVIGVGLKVLLGLGFVLLCIWLLGKIIIFIWDKFIKK